jgi:ubiquinone/menaquinone biosynthesis C-methylase UbiE
MKEINEEKYFNVLEIKDFFTSGETEESIKKSFESGEIKGIRYENEWLSTKENIECYIFKKEKIHISFSNPQEIDLRSIDLKGKILDIGGGGEGIIGQMMGEHVISIDSRKTELEEAIEAGDVESLKIIMDAKDLKFLDNTFRTVTAFFSLMYMPKNDHKQVLTEIYRVLKNKGEFLLWDPIIPENFEKKKDLFAIPIRVQIKDKKIQTGYGTHWNKTQNIDYFLELTKTIGFKVIEQKVKDQILFIRLKKN